MLTARALADLDAWQSGAGCAAVAPLVPAGQKQAASVPEARVVTDV
jgi:hypothetical protein